MKNKGEFTFIFSLKLCSQNEQKADQKDNSSIGFFVQWFYCYTKNNKRTKNNSKRHTFENRSRLSVILWLLATCFSCFFLIDFVHFSCFVCSFFSSPRSWFSVVSFLVTPRWVTKWQSSYQYTYNCTCTYIYICH